MTNKRCLESPITARHGVHTDVKTGRRSEMRRRGRGQRQRPASCLWPLPRHQSSCWLKSGRPPDPTDQGLTEGGGDGGLGSTPPVFVGLGSSSSVSLTQGAGRLHLTHNSGTSSLPPPGTQNRSPASRTDSRLSCSECTWTLPPRPPHSYSWHVVRPGT